MRKIFIAISLGVVLAIILIIGYLRYKTTDSSKPAQQNSVLPASKVELEEYYRVYKNPYVILLRQSLNAYLANDSSQACIFQGAVEEKRMVGIISGLDSFSKGYYKSKFIVATIDDNAENGKKIQIIFQDKPDRIFYAWVGKNPHGEDCLLGFNSKENMNEQSMREMIEFYKPLLFDKEHAL